MKRKIIEGDCLTEMKKFEEKVSKNRIDKLTEKEINNFIDNNFDIWACKFELHPCGNLTLNGKREYIKNNLEEIKRLIQFNKENQKK